MVGCNVFRSLCTRQRRKASAAKKRKAARGSGRQQPEWEAVPVAPEIKALERTMDPILAPRAWNAKNSRLLQLPDEILIEILRTMGPRTPELFMMRRVCRKFRHLINAPDLRKYILSDKGHECIYRPPFYTSEYVFQKTLRRDVLCQPCLKAYYPKDIAEQPNMVKLIVRTVCTSKACTFRENMPRYVYCSGCKVRHPTLAFSFTQQQASADRRICIGREGVVRLCEHKSISLNSIERRVNRGRRLPWNQYISFLERIEYVCKHKSHVFPCQFNHTPGGDTLRKGTSTWLEPSYPRAKISVDQGGRFAFGPCLRLTLEMSWRPHSGQLQWPLKEKVRHHETDAVGMRDLASCYRQGAARFIVPQRSPGLLPEMLCFDPDRCGCLRYEGGVLGPGEASASKQPPFEQQSHCVKEPVQVGTRSTRHWCTIGPDKDESSIRIFPCHDDDTETAGSCIVTCYQRRLYVGELCQRNVLELGAGMERMPTHEWFHAVDLDSYEYAGDVPRGVQDEIFVRPRCRDPQCGRYFRNQGACALQHEKEGFLSVDPQEQVREGVIEPDWVRPRAKLSLGNLAYLSVQWWHSARDGLRYLRRELVPRAVDGLVKAVKAVKGGGRGASGAASAV